MSDNTELGSVGMLALGIDPANSTPADWKRAADAAHQAARRRDRPPVLRPELHQGARERRHLDHPGVVRRHLPGQLLGLPGPEVRRSQGGGDALARQLHDPAARRSIRSTRWTWIELLLPAEDRRRDRRLGQLHLARCRRPSRRSRTQLDDPTVANSPLVFPTAADRRAAHAATTTTRASTTTTSGTASSTRSSSRERRESHGAALREASSPYLLGLPAGAWLVVFFVVPLVAVLSVSLMTGNSIDGFTLTWHFGEYSDVDQQYRPSSSARSMYGGDLDRGRARVAYPVAYWIAFHGGRHKSTYLFLICCRSSSRS